MHACMHAVFLRSDVIATRAKTKARSKRRPIHAPNSTDELSTARGGGGGGPKTLEKFVSGSSNKK